MKTLILSAIFIFAINPLFAQWSISDSTLNQTWESVFFTDENTGYAAGYLYTPVYHAKIKKTTNAGLSWSFLTIPPTDTGEGFTFRSVFFTNINTGYVVGGYIGTPMANGLVLKTTNGGNSWSNVLNLPNNNLFDYVYFINSSTGYLSGYGTIIITTDGGITWSPRNPNFSLYLFQICFTDVNNGYVVGNQGTIFNTTNGSINWNFQPSGTSLPLWGIGFANANTGLAVGGNSALTANIILKTTTGGNSWNQIYYIHSTCFFWRVRFITSSICYLIGFCNQIIKTTDFGATLCYQSPPPGVNCNFRDCYFTNINTGYVVGGATAIGQQGYILKTTNGGGNCIPVGIEPTTNEIPKEYRLYQNYPNPFNPSTKIRFSIPDAETHSNASLRVYDALGKEITVLVNENLKAGEYEVNWDASNYSSGIYFYTFKIADFVDTKKMVIIK